MCRISMFFALVVLSSACSPSLGKVIPGYHMLELPVPFEKCHVGRVIAAGTWTGKDLPATELQGRIDALTPGVTEGKFEHEDSYIANVSGNLKELVLGLGIDGIEDVDLMLNNVKHDESLSVSDLMLKGPQVYVSEVIVADLHLEAEYRSDLSVESKRAKTEELGERLQAKIGGGWSAVSERDLKGDALVVAFKAIRVRKGDTEHGKNFELQLPYEGGAQPAFALFPKRVGVSWLCWIPWLCDTKDEETARLQAGPMIGSLWDVTMSFPGRRDVPPVSCEVDVRKSVPESLSFTVLDGGGGDGETTERIDYWMLLSMPDAEEGAVARVLSVDPRRARWTSEAYWVISDALPAR